MLYKTHSHGSLVGRFQIQVGFLFYSGSYTAPTAVVSQSGSVAEKSGGITMKDLHMYARMVHFYSGYVPSDPANKDIQCIFLLVLNAALVKAAGLTLEVFVHPQSR